MVCGAIIFGAWDIATFLVICKGQRSTQLNAKAAISTPYTCRYTRMTLSQGTRARYAVGGGFGFGQGFATFFGLFFTRFANGGGALRARFVGYLCAKYNIGTRLN